ncbi:hypothetical protein [Yoonia sp. 208BN28-4]|uniref:hypothetical protein n=1 Tax=Yoonia sp. 208BN28-4 TaxID=3126505 RepID=UPI003096D484
MTIQLKTIIFGASISLITACGGTTIDDDMGTEPPEQIRPTPPISTLGTPGQVQALRNEVSDGFGLARNSNFFGPKNGNVTYEGTWITGMTVEGSSDINTMIGDMTMRVDIGGDNNPVTGRVTGLNTANGNAGLESLNGALTISGNIDGTDRRFDAGTMTGNLSGYFGGDQRRTVSTTANISSTSGWRDSVAGARGDVIVGTTTGRVVETDNLANIDITTGAFRVDAQN